MTVISCQSGKGGISKSSLARALAIESARTGLSVHLADLDTTQGTLIDWHRDRLAAGLLPMPVVEAHRSLKDAVRRAAGVDLLVLDAPGRADHETLSVARVSHLTVLPTGASLDDLRPAVRVANSLTSGGIRPERILFVLARISSAASAASARAFITAAGYRVSSGYLLERVAYQTAQNGGRALTEVPFSSLRASAERVIQSVIDSVPEE